MTSLGSYLLGVAQLAVVVFAVGFSAYRLRQRLLPGWEGAPARRIDAFVAGGRGLWLSQYRGSVRH